MKDKEQAKQYAKQYRLENKEKIKEYKNKTFICTCDKVIKINNKKKHLNTIKHIE